MQDIELLEDQPLGEKLIKKGSRAYFFMFLIAPVGYFMRVIVSNKLEVGDIGLFYSVLGFITLVSLYNDLGLTEALQYFLPKYWIEKKYNSYKTIFYVTLVLQLITGILIAGGIYLGADWLALHHFHSEEAIHLIRILCFYFVGINFLQAFNSFYLGFQDVTSSSLTDFFRLYGALAFTIFFRLTNSLTSISFSLAWITGLGIGLVASTIIFFKKYLYTLKRGSFIWDMQLIKKQFTYAFWIFLGANAGSLLGQVDQQLVINFLGPIAAGYYTNFFGLFAMFNIIVSPILGLLFPIVTELATKNDTRKLGFLQNILYKYFSVFALSIGGIFFALGPQLAAIFFGSKFTYSGQLITYTSPFFVIHVLIAINYGILAGIGKAKERVKIIGRALLVNVLLNVLLVVALKVGVIGAVISLIAGWIVLRILSFKLVHRHQFVTFDWKYFIMNACVIVALTTIFYLIKDRFFIVGNSYRYQNIYNFIMFLIIYYGIIGMFNYKSIKVLIGEIRILKRSV